MSKHANIEQLETIMAKLRDPKTGCPWDLKQTFQTILPYTIEEVYEVADAIEKNDIEGLKSELGDLLFQVVFYAQLASENNQFDLADVINKISQKLTVRHPHVFDRANFDGELDDESLNRAWEKQKQTERLEKGDDNSTKENSSLLDDIPPVLPELKKAQKIQNRVAKHGFDWDCVERVWEKVEEEALEVKQAASEDSQEHLQEEIGDLLFAIVNLSRHYKVDADFALRQANKKFDSRFRKVESLAENTIDSYSLDELEKLWQIAKKSD